ncbi:MAG: trypsin-like peptidase domain-containing protein [Chloroflexia bacterium]|nr:trypsin-like peptidase domain-containing protein [Chloroflexia bacterium]
MQTKMLALTLTVTMTAAVSLAGAVGGAAQDLFPTPEGRLGGREPLPTPAVVEPLPTPPIPTPSPAITATASAMATATAAAATTATASVTAEVAASPPGLTASPLAVEVEAGALASARAGTVTVVTWRDEGATLGSGWILDADGRVVTASAVVGDAARVEVVAADGRLLPATLLGSDPLTGIAVLDVRGLGLLPLLPGGLAEPGLGVVAIGTAEGRFAGTMVEGAVSTARGAVPEGYPATTLILTTAAPLDGMAGGPLVGETTGEVVGLLVPGPGPGLGSGPPNGDGREEVSGEAAAVALPAGGTGLGLAVPIATVERVAAELIRSGSVAYPYLGAVLEPVTTERASQLGLPVVRGMVAREVVEGGPADRAGIAPGDVIVRVAGTPSGLDLPFIAAVTGRVAGEEVVLELLRDGTRTEVAVVLGERPFDS